MDKKIVLSSGKNNQAANERKRTRSQKEIEESQVSSSSVVNRQRSPLGIESKQSKIRKVEQNRKQNVRKVLLASKEVGENNNAQPIKEKGKVGLKQGSEKIVRGSKTVEESNQFEDELDYEDDTEFEQAEDPDNYPMGDGIRVLVEGNNTPTEDISSDEEEEIQDERASIVSSVDNEVFLRQPQQVAEPTVQFESMLQNPSFKTYIQKVVNETWSVEKAQSRMQKQSRG